MECEQPDRARIVVRQGDVLAAHPGTDNWSDRWRRFFIVLSADCDIVNSKLDTGLVVVPVIGLQTYALDVWLPEQVRRSISACEKKVEPLINRFPGLVPSSAAAFAADKGHLEREFALRCGDDKELCRAARSIQSLRDGFTLLQEIGDKVASVGMGELGPLVRKLCEVRTVLTGNAVDAEKELKGGLASVADPKRNDFWPLCDLVGLDGQMREDERDGFAAALRRFTHLPTEKALVDKGDWLKSRDSYLRICRLRGVYKTDFLHRFASLFTRVGLDAGRDSEHQRVFDLAAARALQEKDNK